MQKEILPRMQFIRFLIYDCLTFSCLSCGPGAFFSLVHILVLEVNNRMPNAKILSEKQAIVADLTGEV